MKLRLIVIILAFVIGAASRGSYAKAPVAQALALALARKGEFARAAELLEEAAESSTLARYYAGWMRARAGQWREAAAHWGAINPATEWGRKARDAALTHLREIALAAYRADHPADALEASELALDFAAGGETLAEIDALAGMSLLRLGRAVEARARLAAVAPRLAQGDLRREVERMLSTLSPSRVTELGATIGAGHNSNLFGDGESEDTVSAAFTDLDAWVGQVWAGRYFALLRCRWQEYLGMPDNRYLEMSAGVGARMHYESYGVEVEFGALYQNLGNDSDAASPRARLLLERRFGARVLAAEYQLSRPLVALDDFQYLSADQHELVIRWSPVGADWRPSLAADFRREGGTDLEDGTLQLPLEHVALGASSSVIGPLGARTWLTLSAGIEHRIYDQKAFPGIEDRLDWTFSLGAYARRVISGGLGVFVSGKAELNRSTLGEGDVDDRNSFGTVLAGGLEWRG